MSEESIKSNPTIPRPTKEVLEFLQWAVGAAVNEYGADVNDTDNAAYAWLNEVEKVCGYADGSK